MAAPERPTDLVAAAETVAAALPAAFVRVDLLEERSGPAFGETTPFPFGGSPRANYYGAIWDEYPGRRWEQADVELTAQRPAAAPEGG